MIRHRLEKKLAAFRHKLLRWVLPPPRGCEDGLYSMILPVHEDSGEPPGHLLEVAQSAITAASEVDLDDIVCRIKNPPCWPRYWPGEHYKLLAGLIRSLKPLNVIEIGTFTGLSALVMKKYLPRNGVLTTFDILDWNSIPGTCLEARDFEDGSLVQLTADLGDAPAMKKYASLIGNADLIFVDGPKDGAFEIRFLQNLDEIEFAKPALLVFDDIRLWNMLAIWRGIKRPKLDLTSFGHWSGTGLVSWR